MKKIVTFGEIMGRFAPEGFQRFIQCMPGNLNLTFGGAESNVAGSISYLGLKTAFVSNSCAAYRRSYLEEVGFFPENLIFGEDTCTAGRLLKRGYKIAYVAEAAVFHSHNYTLIQEFRRSFDIGVLHRSEQWLCDTFGRAEGEGMKYIRYELSMLLTPQNLHQLPLFFCRNLTKFIGYKFGTKYGNLPQCILPKLSMNSGWWHRNVTR